MLQLADHSIAFPRGVIEDVLVKVDKFIFPAYFIMKKIERFPLFWSDPSWPLGEPSLMFKRAKVQEEEVTFNVSKAMKLPDEPEGCFRANVIESSIASTVKEVMMKSHSIYPLEAAITSARELFDLLNSYKKLLWSGCSNHSELSYAVRMLSIKTKENIS
ncbi:Aspartic peptidase domain containing protein [Senna tora]|uniref:Aspartic peptidase domain containing protein n=1 Tax=Senna tora TaxID=362788 RepID=A0A835CJ64_9FABA|nr:Aspartic peptidase domain containing protein [Senna tora]